MDDTRRSHRETVDVGGETIVLETGRLARQAHGAVVVRHRATMVLATVVGEPHEVCEVGEVGDVGGATAATGGGRPARDFLPLTVEYRERMSAGGRIPGAYGKREGRLADHEVLTSRLIDRSLRPLFPSAFDREVQVTVTPYAVDPQSDLESLAVLAACAAVHASDLPFAGPVAGLRAALRKGKLVLMPSWAVRDEAELEWLVAATRAGLVMVEGGACEVSDGAVLEAFDAVTQALGPVWDAFDRLRATAGSPKRSVRVRADAAAGLAALDAALAAACKDELAAAFDADKARRRAAIAALPATAASRLGDAHPGADFAAAAERAWRTHVRSAALTGRRIGARGLTDSRAIESEVGLLATNHGSALFTRGETQALVSVTLGGVDEGVSYETPLGKRLERFMLHYNFPSFAVGEARPPRGPGRREIGHGALARRGLLPVLPADEDLPYAVRVVSDILASNGSSSMATVCGGSLALMDAGVPLTAPVAGIAMGLIQEGAEAAILSDISGDEDQLGDMDFKVCATAKGITALQLDNKLGAVSRAVLERAIAEARVGITHILAEMQKTLAASRPLVAPHAPQAAMTRIPAARIGVLIGPGGKNIQELQQQTGTRIDVKDDGRVRIFAKRAQDLKAALERVGAIGLELKVGQRYRAEVVSTKEYGAFVRIGDHEGLVHVSELAHERVERVEDIVKPGASVDVCVLGADERGRLKLSRKAALGG